jgi:putative flippase GtrA
VVSLSPPVNQSEHAPGGSRLSMLQYSRFLLVGLVVGLIAIFAREWIARALPADSPLFYSISVVVVYAAGIVLSFALHSRFTFGTHLPFSRTERFAPFLAVALVGAMATWLISITCRYAVGFDKLFGAVAGSVAFAVGAVAASILTYILNAHMVFHHVPPEQNRLPGPDS